MVDANKQVYKKTKSEAFLTKPLRHDQFRDMVHHVAVGPQQTLVLCADVDTPPNHDDGMHTDDSANENKYTMVVQMGVIKVLKEKFEESCTDAEIVERGRFSDDKLYMLEDICSVPFDVPFDFPVTKVSCGFNFAAILTATGDVFTWGSNAHGELGIDDEKLVY